MWMCRKGCHTRGYSLYVLWISDSGNLVVLLGSLDSYSYLYQKDHIKQIYRYINIYIYIYIYIYNKVRKRIRL